MKIFIAILKNNFKSLLAERVDFIVPPLVNIVWVGVMYFLWTHIFAGGLKDVGGFNQGEIVRYYLVMFFLGLLVVINLAPDVTRWIAKGEINQHLLKPYSVLTVMYNTGLTRFIFNLCVAGLCVLVIILFSPDLLAISWFNFLCLMPIVILALFLSLSITVLIGLVAFWTTETIFLQIFANLALLFFGGVFFPLTLLQGFAGTLTSILPFKYMLFFPAQVALGKLPKLVIVQGMGMQIIWLLLLVVVIRLVWKKGLRKYEAFGG